MDPKTVTAPPSYAVVNDDVEEIVNLATQEQDVRSEASRALTLYQKADY